MPYRQSPDWEAQITDLRPVPHSFEAEEQVLASVLCGDPDAWKVAKRMLQPADFYRDRHQFIFSAMLRVAKTHGVNQITVAHDLALQGKDLLQACGGEAYLSMLIANMMSSVFIEDYCWVVKDCSERRAKLGKAKELQDEARQPSKENSKPKGGVRLIQAPHNE